MGVMKAIADTVIEKQLQMRDVIQMIDKNRTGFISRQNLTEILRSLCESFTLD